MAHDEGTQREQRAFRRTELSTAVEIEIERPENDTEPRSTSGRLLDVGVGGILVRVDEGVAEGTLCTVRFADPDAGDLEARGFVRRVRADDEGVLLGIEFEQRIEALRQPTDDDALEGMRLRSTRVLVVDDEPSVVELLYRFLSARGCDVTTATSGEQALDILRRQAHDITMLDLKMPGVDGLEVLRAIREESLPAGNIWAISGYATDDEARVALQEGAADFINKPLDLKYLEWSMQLHRAAV